MNPSTNDLAVIVVANWEGCSIKYTIRNVVTLCSYVTQTWVKQKDYFSGLFAILSIFILFFYVYMLLIVAI